ncbi:hypothetical protein [Nocardia vermiculata]|uniref:Uncharacterized protein n=1 Tax=Nocardia vermiculata TaxID=257274 RepID=A0A846Y7M9_9NOCA|nr:hypothetical protein [Nocardia vermiculata]NKY53814.1 hypothetical protein [Nocardia vermiculata]
MLDRLAERDVAWRYGNEEPGTLLTDRDWQAVVTRLGTPGVPQDYLVRATK